MLRMQLSAYNSVTFLFKPLTKQQKKITSSLIELYLPDSLFLLQL